MIRSFRNKSTESIWKGEVSRSLPRNIQDVSRRKLRMINNAQNLNDLRVPPGNRKGQHSIRINDQWRICFRWSKGDALEVEIVDYH
ncbi:MAG: type II toxin-antitoxin system RelE/ParE family toxin [Deltaproteobacteria bacterium]|nr:type II toxin-antitoxin system RelE/ParE family toxin [Deltaproteobacteria bacterium]MBW1873038.1 type II toxin-antitoxin system RelE/ParE family toxin [Deltaproteobacteria bacterium]